MRSSAVEGCGCVDALYAREEAHRSANAIQQAIAAVHLGRKGRLGLDKAMDRLHAVAALNAALATARQRLVDAASRIGDVCAAVATAAGADDNVDVVANVDPVLVDEAALRPVLMIVAELVGNSVRHAFEDGRGTVLVKLRHEGGGTALVVEDTGRCGGWNREGGQGRGIVDDLAACVGGAVSRTLTPGGSSRVEVSLPLLAAAASQPAGHA